MSLPVAVATVLVSTNSCYPVVSVSSVRLVCFEVVVEAFRNLHAMNEGPHRLSLMVRFPVQRRHLALEHLLLEEVVGRSALPLLALSETVVHTYQKMSL